MVCADSSLFGAGRAELRPRRARSQTISLHGSGQKPVSKIRAADAKEVGVGNPAEETCCYPNSLILSRLPVLSTNLCQSASSFGRSSLYCRENRALMHGAFINPSLKRAVKGGRFGARPEIMMPPPIINWP